MAFDYKPEKVYANRNTVFYEGSCGNCRELAIRFIAVISDVHFAMLGNILGHQTIHH